MPHEVPNVSRVALAIGSSEAYAMGAAVTIHTALANLAADSTVRLIVMDGGMSRDSRARLTDVVRSVRPDTVIDWHVCEIADFEGLPMSAWGAPAAYLRFLLPKVAGDIDGLVLYLDSDLLVRGNLAELVGSVTQAPAPIHAVRDYAHRTAASVFGEPACLTLGIDPQVPYFNAGLMVIDLPSWRSTDVVARAVSALRDHPELTRFGDQDGLNIAVSSWQPLDDRWNVMVGIIDRYVDQTVRNPSERRAAGRALLRDAAVLHFVGPKKPWVPGHRGVGGREYRRALLQSGWFRTWTEKAAWRMAYAVRSAQLEGRRALRIGGNVIRKAG